METLTIGIHGGRGIQVGAARSGIRVGYGTGETEIALDGLYGPGGDIPFNSRLLRKDRDLYKMRRACRQMGGIHGEEPDSG